MSELHLRLHDTLTGQLAPLVPRQPGAVGVYTCGPTTYDVAHVGHARAAIAPDVLVRHLRGQGLKVTYVRNITDVDDNILKRALRDGSTPLELSDRMAKLYQDDMRAMGCAQPDVEPRVSEHIPAIVALVEKLVALGSRLRGDHAERRAGRLLQRPRLPRVRQALQARRRRHARGRPRRGLRGEARSARLRPVEGVRHAGGVGLGQPVGQGAARAGTSSARRCRRATWGTASTSTAEAWTSSSPTTRTRLPRARRPTRARATSSGSGSTTASSTSTRRRCRSRSATSSPSATCSARNDAEALRYFLLTVHYRGPIGFDVENRCTACNGLRLSRDPAEACSACGLVSAGRVLFPGVVEAERRVDYLYQALARLNGIQGPTGVTMAASVPRELLPFTKLAADARERVAAALDDDLNTPVALAVLGELAKAANELADLIQKRKKDADLQRAAPLVAAKLHAAIQAALKPLGLLQTPADVYRERTQKQRLAILGLTAEQVEARLVERTAARQAKDFARADALRKELDAKGIEVADSPEGSTWRVSPP